MLRWSLPPLHFGFRYGDPYQLAESAASTLRGHVLHHCLPTGLLLTKWNLPVRRRKAHVSLWLRLRTFGAAGSRGRYG